MSNPILKYFRYEHLPEKQKQVSQKFSELAHHLADTLPMSAELATSLRKLLEGKDAAVRASLEE